MYAVKASVAQVDRQILRPKFPYFLLLKPQFALSFCVACGILLKDPDINCTSISVHIFTAGCQPLLRALRFAQHNNNMFQQAHYMHGLVFILWPKPRSNCHPLSSFSKQCLSDVHVPWAPKLLAPKWPWAISRFPNHCIRNFTHEHWVFHGRLVSLGHSKIHLSPDHSS
jgi:hypothetical protein